MDFSRYDDIPYGPFLEEWKDIPGYEGIYLISNYGRVKNLGESFVSKDKKENDGSKILKKVIHPNGYCYANISKKGVKKSLRVHKYVGICFIDNPNKKPYINHIRGFKDDNCFTQLEWMTDSENKLHAFRYLKIESPFKGKFRINDTCKKVIRINIKTGETKIYNHCASVKEDGFLPKKVNECCNKIKSRNTHAGYKWEFA